MVGFNTSLVNAMIWYGPAKRHFSVMNQEKRKKNHNHFPIQLFSFLWNATIFEYIFYMIIFFQDVFSFDRSFKNFDWLNIYLVSYEAINNDNRITFSAAAPCQKYILFKYAMHIRSIRV